MENNTENNIKNSRKAGVLLSVTSLPGPFGIGVFGEEACEFVDFLAETGFSYWQILPLGTLDFGNSPYCSDSSLAGNVLLIDPRGLEADGLLKNSDVEQAKYAGTPYTVDYSFVNKSKIEVLKVAFRNYKLFSAENIIKKEFSVWLAKNDWATKYGEYSAKKRTIGDEIDKNPEFYVFCQFLFFKQWKKIKAYANSKNIKIIGDMPLYVSLDSCDIYENPQFFQLDEEKKPKAVAGVPPDYFSEDGQLWGNPLYDWDAMERDGYSWWKKRIENALCLYDVVRFDHFRGLASYWSVPQGAGTAKEGHWEKGPGMKLFVALGYKNPSERFIAEDLGVFGEDVVSLLQETGLPSMRVVQFAFDGDKKNVHLPHNLSKNTVFYTGTHDNNTLLGWIWEITPEERKNALDYCGFYGRDWSAGGYNSESVHCLIENVWKSVADIAIVAFQDMCGFGCDARMNIPGVAEKNWRFRTTKDTINGIDKEYFKKINKLFGRI